MYNKTVRLKDNESLAKIDKETGEVIPLGNRANNIPEGDFKLKYKNFSQLNHKAISFLELILTNEELGIVLKMIKRADFNSNAMVPLSDDSSLRDLAKEFNISKNKVSNIFKKLFDLGTYSHIKVANGHTSEYWVLNPYISWKGKFINDSIYSFFNHTAIAKACN